MNGHDQANRTLLEQIMKLTQDMKVGIWNVKLKFGESNFDFPIR